MKTRFLRTAAAMALLAVSTALAAEGQAADPTITLQATCPVMGGAIDRKLYVDHEGQRIYVCCAGCIDAVKKDPAAHVKAMQAKGVALEASPVAAP